MTDAVAETREVMERLKILEDAFRQLQELLMPRGVVRTTSQETDHPYIERGSDILSGEPIIKGTRTPVRAIVEHWKFGDSPEEIARQLPHLRLAQIFDALSYYDDHRSEIEHYIALNRVTVDEMMNQLRYI